MKIYTKTGDTGETSLFGGKRVKKYHARIEAYGTIDELNSNIGVLLSYIDIEKAIQQLSTIQNTLFTVGSILATETETILKNIHIDDKDIMLLEVSMDDMEAELMPLRNFILPSGHIGTAQAHVCRTVCRRAERLIILLSEEENINPIIIQYVNRLSDYFFMLARYIAHKNGVKDVEWQK